MTRPLVTIHTTVSLDGRLTGFPVDLGLYYEIAGRIRHDAVLTGSGTMLAAALAEGIDLDREDPDHEPSAVSAEDPRPLLVVVDSRGRLPRLDWLRGQPFWRDVLILCSERTPADHLRRLRRHGVAHVIVGADHVDLPAALNALALHHAVRAVRVDAGGTLNGRLLHEHLVDEVSLIIAPVVAAASPTPLGFHVPSGEEPPLPLILVGNQTLREGHVWLRYSFAPP